MSLRVHVNGGQHTQPFWDHHHNMLPHAALALFGCHHRHQGQILVRHAHCLRMTPTLSSPLTGVELRRQV